jgi:hypothetical protein
VEGFGINALIGAGSCIVDDFGEIIAPSKLSVKMLRLELRERGLDTEGSRGELYARLQEARQTSEVTASQGIIFRCIDMMKVSVATTGGWWDGG